VRGRVADDAGGQAAATATSRLRLLRAGAVAAEIDAENGGLLTSVAIDGDELLAPVVPQPRGVPRGGSYLLAPWVGELFEGRLPFRGREHRLPTGGDRHAIHGLVFSGAWEVEDHTERRVGLRRDLVAPWPFGGWVRQAFALDPAGLTQTAEITAGSRAMPVSLGWHPWFRVSDPERVSVTVDARRHLVLDADLIPTGASHDVAGEVDLRDGPAIGGRRMDVVYVDVASPARLMLPGRTVVIDFDPAISIVVVYAADGSVCIEPWTSWPDAANASARGHDAGLIILEAGETVSRWMRWTWSPT
jgi:aldose 1-epimerase